MVVNEAADFGWRMSRLVGVLICPFGEQRVSQLRRKGQFIHPVQPAWMIVYQRRQFCIPRDGLRRT